MEVSLEELEATLKCFKKYKSLGPDGWSIVFYLDFFGILGADLLKVIEDSRLNDRMHAPFSSTFITLIPKIDNPTSFGDYRPISLCYFIYKIMAKIITNKQKPILSNHISLEQFSFLQDRQIHEAMATTQEIFHSLHVKEMKGMILKVDLSKAFDRVCSLYLRMLLTHLGFPFAFINWIMSCITDRPFSVLVNGSASPLFHSKRGLCQG